MLQEARARHPLHPLRLLLGNRSRRISQNGPSRAKTRAALCLKASKAEGPTAKYATRAKFRAPLAERKDCREKTQDAQEHATSGRKQTLPASPPFVAFRPLFTHFCGYGLVVEPARTAGLRDCVHDVAWRSWRFKNRTASKSGRTRRATLVAPAAIDPYKEGFARLLPPIPLPPCRYALMFSRQKICAT